jgi:hypothetical protein
MKSYFGSNEKGDRPANITFDVPSLLLDGNMVRFITVNAMTVFFF